MQYNSLNSTLQFRAQTRKQSIGVNMSQKLPNRWILIFNKIGLKYVLILKKRALALLNLVDRS